MNALIRRRPGLGLMIRDPFRMLDEFDRLAGDLWHSWQPAVFDTALHPNLDMYEEEGDLVVKAELPGIDKDGLDISIDGDVLRIKGERNEEREETNEDTHYYTYERHYGRYSRSVPLPFPVDTEKVSATLENGVLQIRMPKAEEAGVKHVEIKPQLSAKAGKKTRKARTKKTEAKAK